MRFEDLLDRHERGYLTQEEAGEMLGVSGRTFRRWRDRWREDGAPGLLDRRVGKVSPRRAAASELARARALYAEMYDGFTVKHFHEKLVERHGYKLGYTVTRLALQSAGLVSRAPRRGAHRRKRPRRPVVGMLLHQDGSTHCWLPGVAAMQDLIVTLDDATGAILSGFLVEEEGTASSFRGLGEVIAAHGLPCSLYTDRASHYFHTPAAGGKVDRDRPTQVGRALAQLGIEHIAAYSPEARGRSERAFRTLQDRLPKELALAGIDNSAAANRFLAETFIPDYNARFAVPPEAPGSAFVPVAAEHWQDVLCVQEERVVGNDNTVRFQGRILQIPPSPLRHHYVRTRVRVHHYPNGEFAIFHGPRPVARYNADGALTGHQHDRAAA